MKLRILICSANCSVQNNNNINTLDCCQAFHVAAHSAHKNPKRCSFLKINSKFVVSFLFFLVEGRGSCILLERINSIGPAPVFFFQILLAELLLDELRKHFAFERRQRSVSLQKFDRFRMQSVHVTVELVGK